MTVAILLGAPGAGKGTQAPLLSASLDAPVLASGELLRSEVTSGSEDWIVPGGVLIWLAPDRGYTLWDGVMFEVRR